IGRGADADHAAGIHAHEVVRRVAGRVGRCVEEVQTVERGADAELRGVAASEFNRGGGVERERLRPAVGRPGGAAGDLDFAIRRRGADADAGGQVGDRVADRAAPLRARPDGPLWALGTLRSLSASESLWTLSAGRTCRAGRACCTGCSLWTRRADRTLRSLRAWIA